MPQRPAIRPRVFKRDVLKLDLILPVGALSVVRLPLYILWGMSRNSKQVVSESAFSCIRFNTCRIWLIPRNSPVIALTYWVTSPTPKAPPSALRQTKR